MLAGVAATAVLAVRAGERVEVISLAHRLEAGRPLPVTAFRKAEIAAPAGDFVAWSERERLAGEVTSVSLLPGTLLTRAMTVPAASEHLPGKARVGLLLKPGQFPAGLTSGSRVQVVHAAEGTSIREGEVLVPSARVDSVDRLTPGRVAVIVDSALSPRMVTYASNGEIAIGELPAQRGPATDPAG
ncbi:hypothetical protein [Nonomuraea rhizosphaerae]|uniref:hypothetical protein n=1 Tax=Nonomuraea rhizosphaerae TaxID=2665663 RepID=UPI001C5F0B4B|nr:hypothetical protein [Nonomuraea rhizosphaerae]